jgi:hypothetical protein
MENKQPCPQSRSEDLLSTELPDGLLVYDLTRDHGHFLNQTAALIWHSCDGRTNVAELAQRLAGRELPNHEEVVWLALERLSKAHLLCEPLPRPLTGMSRRRVIRKLGLAGLAALLPAVVSLTAPTPAVAASGVGGGGGGVGGGGN